MHDTANSRCCRCVLRRVLPNAKLLLLVSSACWSPLLVYLRILNESPYPTQVLPYILISHTTSGASLHASRTSICHDLRRTARRSTDARNKLPRSFLDKPWLHSENKNIRTVPLTSRPRTQKLGRLYSLVKSREQHMLASDQNNSIILYYGVTSSLSSHRG